MPYSIGGMTTSQVASVVLGPGQTAQLNVDGSTVSLQVTTPEPAAPAHVVMIGMEAANGQPTVDVVAQYAPSDGRAWTMRDFGSDGTDTDADTEPTAPGTGKLADTPANCIMHESWKDTTPSVGALVKAWLDTADPARSRYWSWWHEVNRAVPATANANLSAGIAAIEAHPKAALVLGYGPILTRYWLDEGAGDASLYVVPEMRNNPRAFFAVDCYSQDTSRYWTPEELFGVAFGKIRAACPGIRIVVPEMGLLRTTTDKDSGQGRATALRGYLDYLRAQPDVDYANYWNSYVVNGPDYRLPAGSPEAAVWQEYMGH